MTSSGSEVPGLTYWYDAQTQVLTDGEIAELSESVLADKITASVAHAQSVATAVGVADAEVRVTIRTEWTKPLVPIDTPIGDAPQPDEDEA